MTQPSTDSFSKWRSFFWPVHRFELKKVLPMLGIVFLVLFNYTLLRDGKDSLIVPNCGAETIPFLKVYGTVPIAILFMVIYSRLSNTLSKEKLFYTCLMPFLIFFGLFALVIYPCRDLLHPTTSAEWLRSVLPKNLGGLAGMYEHWTFSLFYVFSELWGSVALSLLFWGFANDITRVSEAKRYYPLFNLGGNLALMLSGPTIILSTMLMRSLPKDLGWQYALNIQMSIVVVNTILIMVLYRWMTKNVLTDPRFFNPDEVRGKKSKPKMGIMESFAYLAKSRYILCLALIVLSYGVAINLIEVTWKGQLKEYFPDPLDYNQFMGYFSFFTGFVTLLLVLVGSNFLRRFGWSAAAAWTPLVLAVTGGCFFAFTLMKQGMAPGTTVLGLSPLLFAVLFGATQNILTKASKYALFDPTKEMAYIPLDQEQKVKGKAAIDVVGARLGKSGGSFVQQLLIAAVGFGAIVPYVAIICGGMVVMWLFSVRSLGKQFNELTAEEPAAIEPAATEAEEAEPVAT